ncbi:alpha/beta fold hydrolase [Sphingosinicella rhizophila]|uniref:Alpha/beta hydrolase n=1 Tax=Sphingosinicella rhizophila TaxID=3050082 RepID=A0ABU3Q5K9_9SPHN|nr:alpha/beta hydrolase [Sphingosinicella sp. GR2756]MDT9598695.1 alpha/beta hydrolase [Sphingosinicella sp. GR2756]
MTEQQKLSHLEIPAYERLSGAGIAAGKTIQGNGMAMTRYQSRDRTVLTCCAAAALSLGGCLSASESAVPLRDVGTRGDTPVSESTLIQNRGAKIAFHVTPARASGRGPTIVLDAGGGGDSSYWNDLVPELARRTGARIITYDRAGFGASEERPGPLKIEDAVDDLAQGLKRLGATQNVILVPHSFAGKITTYLARQHPEWISGAVLVDANVPPFFTETMLDRQSKAYAPAIAAMKQSKDQTKQTRSQLALFESFVETARAYHQVAWPAGVPCTVIVAENTPFEDPIDAGAWRNAQAQFAHTSRCKLIVADKSSHDVARDRRDVLIEAVVEMANRVR